MNSSLPADPVAACSPLGELHLVCGKIGSGKSTLCRHLASAHHAVVLSEDVWLAALYPNELSTIADYVRCAGRLRTAIAQHVAALLRNGTSVVLDFPSNTLATRQWARSIIKSAGCEHYLHFLDVPDAVCKARLRARNASGEHPFQATDEEFDRISSHFVAPTDQEAFRLVRHSHS